MMRVLLDLKRVVNLSIVKNNNNKIHGFLYKHKESLFLKPCISMIKVKNDLQKTICL